MKIPRKNNKIKSAAKIIFKAVSMCLTSKKMPDVTLAGYYLTHDDRYIVFDTGADASSGKIRCISKNVRADKMFISFYSLPYLDKACGEYLFPVKLPAECNEIYMYTGNNAYKLTLYKNISSQRWLKA